MIVCPQCLHKEIFGALFCSECGAQLIFDGPPTYSNKSDKGSTAGYNAAREPEDIQSSKVMVTETPVALKILSASVLLPINPVDEVTLGRVSEGQPVVPDIDLTPYKAYEAGVSRMHARLQFHESRLTVTDLGSANGTRLNGRPITSHIPYPLNHEDVLTLGKFKIQILLRSQ